MIVRFSLVPWLCRGMPTGGSASTIFTVFEAEPQTPIPSRSLGTSSIMFNNGWVDEFLGMFDICFSMILLIT